MPDDLDQQIRAAMKTLDEQVPSGYFEALPNQILARLEDGSMQQGTGTSNVMNKPKGPEALMGAPVAATPPAAAKKADERSEDSGLHDIRNLAQSTKQRLSSKRTTQNPPIADDVLAASSGSWKHVALPEPAKMVSLPDIASLPSKAEIAALEKAEAKRLAEETKAKARAKKGSVAPPVGPSGSSLGSDDVLAPVATANAALDAMSAKPAALPERQAFSLPSQQNKRSKGPVFAVLGLGVAAAAGGLIFMQMNKEDAKSAAAIASAPASDTVQAKAEPPKAPEQPEPAPPPAAVEAAAAGSAAAEPAAAEEADEPTGEAVATADAKASKPSKRGKGKKTVEKEEPAPKEETKVVVEDKKEPEKVEPKKGGKGEGEGEPSFDALLKEAGVDDKKKEEKPKLDKKSLSADDFKKGMAGIAGKAQGCYKGTQGTAMVKLTVAPSGKVSKVAIAGQFAGSPEGNCVESAVKSASFPPWDGGPQSFTYSYMLAD
jgi:hypothetical protein